MAIGGTERHDREPLPADRIDLGCSTYRRSYAESPKHLVNEVMPIGQTYEKLPGLLLTANWQVGGEESELCARSPASRLHHLGDEFLHIAHGDQIDGRAVLHWFQIEFRL